MRVRKHCRLLVDAVELWLTVTSIHEGRSTSYAVIRESPRQSSKTRITKVVPLQFRHLVVLQPTGSLVTDVLIIKIIHTHKCAGHSVTGRVAVDRRWFGEGSENGFRRTGDQSPSPWTMPLPYNPPLSSVGISLPSTSFTSSTTTLTTARGSMITPKLLLRARSRSRSSSRSHSPATSSPQPPRHSSSPHSSGRTSPRGSAGILREGHVPHLLGHRGGRHQGRIVGHHCIMLPVPCRYVSGCGYVY